MDRGSQLDEDDADDKEDEEDEEDEEEEDEAGGGRRRKEEEEEEEDEEEEAEATNIKSNNPHLAGGEQRVRILRKEQQRTLSPIRAKRKYSSLVMNLSSDLGTLSVLWAQRSTMVSGESRKFYEHLLQDPSAPSTALVEPLPQSFNLIWFLFLPQCGFYATIQ